MSEHLFGGIPVSERNSSVRASFRGADDHDGAAHGRCRGDGKWPRPSPLHRRAGHCALTTARLQLLGRLFPTDLPSPAGPTFRLSATVLLPLRERVQDGIGMPGAMAAVARPGILARIGHHRARTGLASMYLRTTSRWPPSWMTGGIGSGPARRGRWFPVSGGAARCERRSRTGGCG